MSFTLYRKIVRNYQDFGFKIATIKILKHLVLPFYASNDLTLYELDIDASINYKEQAIDIKYIILEENDENIVSQIVEVEEWLKSSLKQKLKDGSICSVALHNNEVIGFIVTSRKYGEMPTVKTRVKIGDSSVWGDQISVKKKFRKLGISNGLRKCLYPELKKRGIKRLFGYRADYNIASKMSTRKFIKQILVNVKYQRFLFLKKLFIYRLEYPLELIGPCTSKRDSKTRIKRKDSDGYFVIDIDTIEPATNPSRAVCR